MPYKITISAKNTISNKIGAPAKAYINLVVALFLLLGISEMYAIAQNEYITPVVQISKEKVTADNGMEFYLHEVKSKETVTAICRAYGIPQKDIVAANPGLIVGNIGIGQKLRIPVSPMPELNMEDDYYTYHITAKGETISAISRKYNVNAATLEEHNPELKISVLQEKQVVKVPKQGSDFSRLKSEIEQTREVAKNAPNYLMHTVKKGETAFSISKAYDITAAELTELNPELNSRRPLVKTGQELKIKLLPPNKKYISHVVQRRETFSSIATHYNISINEILEANTNIQPNSLRLNAGQILSIPVVGSENDMLLPVDRSNADTVIIQNLDLSKNAPRQNPANGNANGGQQLQSAAGQPGQSTANQSASVAGQSSAWTATNPAATNPFIEKSVNKNNLTIQNTRFKVAFLLPLKESSGLLNNTETNPNPAGNNNQIINPLRSRVVSSEKPMPALEFYKGALLALDSLKMAGLNTDVYFFDTGNISELRQCLNRPDMSQMDLIVGPFFSDMLPEVSSFVRNNRIPWVIPATTNLPGEIMSNPYAIQINPDERRGIGAAVISITDISNAQVIFVENGEESNSRRYNLYREALQNHIPDQYRTVPAASLPSSITLGKKNIIIIPSENEAFILKTLVSLNRVARDNDISILAPPSWNNFKSVDLEYFHNLQYHYWSGYHIDYKSPVTNSFLHRFHSAYNTEPHNTVPGSFCYGFMGYDITLFFGSLLMYYGNQMLDYISDYNAASTQSEFRFYRSDAGGFINSRMYLVKFAKDFSIERVVL